MKKYFLLFLIIAEPIISQTSCFNSLEYSFLDATDSPLAAMINVDLNNDGKKDLVTACIGNPKLITYMAKSSNGFNSIVSMNLLYTPHSIATADFNSDGNADIICAGYGSSGQLRFYPGNGTGGFGFSSNTTIPAGSSSTLSVHAADVNNDGKQDMLVFELQSPKLYVFLGNGSGGFSVPSVISNFVSVDRQIFADINNDAKVDMMVAGQNTVQVRTGNGNSTFNTPITYTVSAPQSTNFVATDFNSDGAIDLAVSSGWFNGGLSVLMNNGSGSFLPATTYTHTGRAATICSGDFNSDSKPDIAVSIDDSGSSLDSTLIFIGSGTGTFSKQYLYRSGYNPIASLTGDFNNDGKTDIAVANSMSYEICILTNTGNATFGVVPRINNGAWVEAVVCKDINNDGKVDVAVLDNSTSVCSLRIYAGNGNATFGSPIVGGMANDISTYLEAQDFNNDGALDFVRPLTSGSVEVLISPSYSIANYSLNVGAYDATCADFNGDGKTDIALGQYPFLPSVAVLMNTGSGSFAPATYYTATTNMDSRYINSGDFDNDGSKDILCLSTSSAKFSILKGSLSGTFTPLTPTYSVPSFPTNITKPAVGDLDNDGNLDIIIGINKNIYFYKGNGNCTFNVPIITSNSYGGKDIIVTDMNSDGNLDVLLLADNSVFQYNGNGTGALTLLNRSAAGEYSSSMAVGDINSDGIKDVVVGNVFSMDVSIIPSTIAKITPTTNLTICSGNSATLMAPLGLFSYTWQPGGSNSSTISVFAPGNYSVTISNGSCSATSSGITVNTVVCTGIDEISNSHDEIILMPNPSSDFVLLKGIVSDLESYTIILTDMLGKEILKREVRSDQEKIDLLDVKQGIYVVRIMHDCKTIKNVKLIRS